MKPINKDELYEHLSGFLRERGVDLRPGSYSSSIQSGCNLLTEAINYSHSGLQTARQELDKTLDRMRQVIHEKTAPKSRKDAPPAGTSRDAGAKRSAGPKQAAKAKPAAPARKPIRRGKAK